MDLLPLKNFVPIVVPFLLGALAHKLLSGGRASPRRNEEDVNPHRKEEDVNMQRNEEEEDVNPQRNKEKEDVNPHRKEEDVNTQRNEEEEDVNPRKKEEEEDVNPHRKEEDVKTQRNEEEEDVNPQRNEEDLNPGTPSPRTLPSDYDYEVFLKFNGREIQKGFADHLHCGLINAGIRVFRDEDELSPEQRSSRGIMKAIKSSKILIPIISPDYASREWCLHDLVEMMKCKESGHVVLPIFYKVNPADVRRQTGSFGEAFLYHWKSFDGEVVKEWEEALTEVGSSRGWEVAEGYFIL